MLIQLYKIFQKWSEGGRVWVYSDPHFTGAISDRDEIAMRSLFHYESNDKQIENINAKVGKQDTLLILGDIGNANEMAKINTRKRVLIMGNHDSKGMYYYEPHFQEIYSGPLFISEKILLSHEPILGDSWLNLSGHIHNQEEVDRILAEGKFYINATANLNNYQPICLNDIIKHEGNFKNFISFSKIPSIHRKTIDKAIERKRKKELGKFETN